MGAPRTMRAMTIDEISENFSLLDEWDDRYRYIIELGRALAPLPAEAYTDANKDELKTRLARRGDLAWQQARLEADWLELTDTMEKLDP